MYNDFLDRRLALEGGISDMSTAADRGALSSSVDGVAINGTPINNVPNISSPEAAAVIQNMPPDPPQRGAGACFRSCRQNRSRIGTIGKHN